MTRGEIWWASLQQPKGSEPGYRRPVLIVQSDAFNRSNINTVICAVITSNLNLVKAPGNVRLSKKESNLPRESVINVSQIVTIDRSYITKCVGTVPKRILKQVEDGIKLVLNLSSELG
ncbi:MAG: type II toxin-antitoxin system PemK/MazF family toxin [Candidatus Bathyarchaeota archaeon]|nr:type II toxin-antitoxin system PemK/MazF family toxin [Candidatus Bathyarchaeota archaeon]